jgi:hypothetical protein
MGAGAKTQRAYARDKARDQVNFVNVDGSDTFKRRC